MGSKYQSQNASGYNSNPPPDDGSTVSSNQITWNSTIKGKLADPVKNLADAINTQLVTALDTSVTTTSTGYTTVAGDHQKPILVTGTTTIKLGDATTMGVGYQATIVNIGSATVSVTVATSTDKLCGVANATITLAPLQGATFAVGADHVSYDIVSASNALMMDGADPTKQVKFSLSGLTTGTTRTVAVADASFEIGKAPTRTAYTSGSGTYTTPTGTTRIYVRMAGGGGGGGASATNAGSGGGSTTFGTSLLTCTGGSGGPPSGAIGGSGGTSSGGDVNIGGGQGQAGTTATGTVGTQGGQGAGGPWGGNGAGGALNGNGSSAASNSGAGGGGGGMNGGVSGAGGGAGGYLEKLIVSPSSSYAYAVGAGGNGAGAGGQSGGNGGSGVIIIDEYYD